MVKLSPEVGEKVYNKIMGIAKDTGTKEESANVTSDEAVSSEKKSE